MNSKEKALELYNKFYLAIPSDETRLDYEAARQCALVAVNELLNHCYEVMKPFWEEVKLEIEKL
jgi:hypothetical protein